MNLPTKKRPGDAIRAEDWNMLLDAITARTPRPGVGLKLLSTDGGFSYSSPYPTIRPRDHAPFSAIAIAKSDTYGNFDVTMKEGWVIERQPKTGDHPAVKFWMPVAGGVALNATPRPQICMTDGQTARCHFTTDSKGQVSATPEIVITSDADAIDGTHYSPSDPEGSGTDGNYYVSLFRLDLDANGVTTITPYQQSDIEHWAQLWTGENLGSGIGVFKEHVEAENVYKFRTVEGPGVVLSDDDTIQIDMGLPTFNLLPVMANVNTATNSVTGTDLTSYMRYVRGGKFAAADDLVVDVYRYIAQIYVSSTTTGAPYVHPVGSVS